VAVNSFIKKLSRSWTPVFLAWIIASVATLGSLFFSEVMLFPPCVLCWYQRIAMYPLVLLLLIGLFPFDGKVMRFTIPLAAIGWLISSYHNLLHYGIVPESASPCVQGVSCATIFVKWFGFITIPLMSFTAFTLILSLLLLARKCSYEK
jgi:disulfide bond formation protein DsbB